MCSGGPPYVCTTDNGIRSTFQRTSVLKDNSVHPPTLVYVRSINLILQNASLADSSDPKSKLSLVTKLFRLS